MTEFENVETALVKQSDLFMALVNNQNEVTNAFKQLREEFYKELTNQSLVIAEMENKFNQELQSHKEEMNKKEEVAINSLRLSKRDEKFVNLTEFGDSFLSGMSVGSKTIGDLLRVIGLAKMSINKTIPYERYQDEYTKTQLNEFGYKFFLWYYEKCISKLDEWLDEHNLKEEFYSISKKSEMERFIDRLHYQYVESKRRHR